MAASPPSGHPSGRETNATMTGGGGESTRGGFRNAARSILIAIPAAKMEIQIQIMPAEHLPCRPAMGRETYVPDETAFVSKFVRDAFGRRSGGWPKEPRPEPRRHLDRCA